MKRRGGDRPAPPSKTDEEREEPAVGQSIIAKFGSTIQNVTQTIQNVVDPVWLRRFSTHQIVGYVVLAILIVAGTVFLYLMLRPTTGADVTGEMLFNVGIADFGEGDLSNSGNIRASENGKWLANLVYEKLNTRIQTNSEISQNIGLVHQHLGIIEGKTAFERQENAGILAEKINVDILIFGNLDTNQLPVTFVPEIYFSPRLSGAEESLGASAFGSRIDVRLPFSNVDNRAKLNAELIPRFEALTEFMFGLALFKADEPSMALKQFDLARNIPEWKDEQGKEILYLWIGSTLDKKALKGDEPQTNFCSTEKNEPVSDWQCSEQYYRKALELNSRFARAQIGIGKLWFDQAEQKRDHQIIYDCSAYNRAADEYRKALAPTMEKTPYDFVEIKTYYNIGLAYSSAFLNGCGDSNSILAVENLNLAVSAYEKDSKMPIAREIGANSYYQLGLIYAHYLKSEPAMEMFNQAFNIAQPKGSYEEGWQVIRWYAQNQIGHLYSVLAKNGDTNKWKYAVDAYDLVLKGNRDGRFQDYLVLSDASYNQGIAYYEMGDKDHALIAMDTSIRFSKLISSDQNGAGSYYYQWASDIAMGDIYSEKAISDPTKWSNAWRAYQDVITHYETSQASVPGYLAAEAYYKMGLTYEALNDPANAIFSYQKALSIDSIQPQVQEKVQERLSAIKP